MKHPLKPADLFREVVIYFLWLALGAAISIMILFPAAFLIFGSNRVPPEAAALVFWPAIILITYLRLRKFGQRFPDIGLRLNAKHFLAVIVGLFIGALFMSAAFGILGGTGAILTSLEPPPIH